MECPICGEDIPVDTVPEDTNIDCSECGNELLYSKNLLTCVDDEDEVDEDEIGVDLEEEEELEDDK